MAKNSWPLAGKKLPPAGEREYAEKFSAVIEDLNSARLAKATGRSIETIKAWRTRRAFANGASLINAARAFPSVKAWLLEQIDSQPGGEDSGDATMILQGLAKLAATSGPQGDMARAMLRAMHAPRRDDE